MKKLVLLLLAIVPLIFLLALVYIAGISFLGEAQTGEEGLGSVSFLILIPLITTLAYIFYLIPIFALIIFNSLFGKRIESFILKKKSLILISLQAIVEGLVLGGLVIEGAFDLGKSTNLLVSLFYLYIYIPYLIYRYSNLKKGVTSKQILKFYKKGFTLRAVLVILATLVANMFLGNS